MNTQTAGYQNKLLGAVAQTDYTGGFVCLWRRLQKFSQPEKLTSEKKTSREEAETDAHEPNVRNNFFLVLMEVM